MEPDQGKYIDALNYEALARQLSSAVRSEVVIAEGVCVQQVLEQLRVEPTHRVYVKLLSSRGDWPEGTRLTRSAGELLAEEEILRQMRALIGESDVLDGVPKLEQELRRYHHAYLPHVTAKLFLRAIRSGLAIIAERLRCFRSAYCPMISAFARTLTFCPGLQGHFGSRRDS